MLYLTICIFIVACSDNIAEYTNVTISETETHEITKLPNDLKDLNQSDAETVAAIYLYDKYTRSNHNKTIKNTSVILGEDNKPCMYAVNFNEDGFMLISATTKYYPIIAIIDKGNYPDNMHESGYDVIINDNIVNIGLAQTDRHDFKCQTQWSRFMSSDYPAFETRAYNDYLEAFDTWSEKISEDGHRIIKLTKCKGILPDDVYEKFVAASQSEDLWEGTEYEWSNTAYVVERIVEDFKNIGPLLTTRWKQTENFNTSGYDALGCVTIAVGQMMKFFKHPTYYDWNNMPDEKPNETTTSFLSKLRGELKVSDGGSAKDSDAERVLKSYGYQISKKNHNASLVFAHLATKKRPIYAGGQRSDNIFKGHAWVIDGLYFHEIITTYTLYRLSDVWYPEFKYDNAENADPWTTCSQVTLYHMNWGWGGNKDGWFIDDRIQLTFDNGEKRNYSKNRTEIYIENF